MWGLALPSTVGADGIRVILVRRFGVRVDDTLATILVERGIGFTVALLTAVASLILLRAMLPHDAVYDYAIALGVAGLLGAITILVFSFTDHALNSVLRLVPARFRDSKAVRLVERLHEAYVSLASDRPRIAAFSGLTLVEHIAVIVCFGRGSTVFTFKIFYFLIPLFTRRRGCCPVFCFVCFYMVPWNCFRKRRRFRRTGAGL